MFNQLPKTFFFIGWKLTIFKRIQHGCSQSWFWFKLSIDSPIKNRSH